MRIFKLGAIADDFVGVAGGKARGLDRLVKEGFSVPHGFVLVNVKDEKDYIRATHYYNFFFTLNKVAVRSSAAAEDGVDFSFAGQYKTVLGVQGPKKLQEALRECVNSLTEGPAKDYSEKFGGGTGGMSIVVQQMIEPDFAGVCFTSDPQNPKDVLIEAVAGLGEALVSGESAAARYSIGAGTDIDKLCAENNMLTAETVREIVEQVLRMKDIFQMPLDTEFAVKRGKLYWLQARPITVTETCEEDEFDPKTDLEGCVTSRCNIGEMLPGAVTPLTRSVSLYAIDWGLRKMLQIAGANRKMKELAPFDCTFSARGHLFFNLSTIYAMANTTSLAGKRDVDMSICGRVLEEDDVNLKNKKKPNGLVRLNNTRKYLGFVMSRKKARKKLVRVADKFSIAGGRTAAEFYANINRSKHVADKVTYLHYITSSHSGAMSSAAIRILGDKLGGHEEGKAALAEFLQGIDGIESVDILASLRRVARAVLKANPAAADLDAEKLAGFIKNTDDDEIKREYKVFMSRHGHRAIREAEMRSKAWNDDERAFMDYLRSVVKGGAEDSVTSLAPDIKAKIAEHGFKGFKAKILGFLIRQSRQGVRNREFSKSRMIKVLDVFKKAYAKLAGMLVSEGKLPDEDAIYFLTHEELGLLAENGSAALVKKALQRRRLLKSQFALRFSEAYIGVPKPLPAVKPENAGDTLNGTPISRGSATGSARVVRSAEDAAKLQKGEIMVAAYTDIGWSPFYALIEALVTEVGSALSHGAVVAREYALPLVANVADATSIIKTGDKITVDGAAGVVIRHLK